jgi:hypothetical protein
MTHAFNKRRALPPLDPENLDSLADAYRAGYSISDLAEVSGLSRTAVRSRLVGAGCEIRRRGGNYLNGLAQVRLTERARNGNQTKGPGEPPQPEGGTWSSEGAPSS